MRHGFALLMASMMGFISMGCFATCALAQTADDGFVTQAESDSPKTEKPGPETPSVANTVLRGQPINLLAENSLDGWANANGKVPKQGWSVKDGVLSRGTKRGGDLYHKHWYRDFELVFEWKISEGGNSGVKYRVQKYGKQNLGCEYQLQDDRGNDFDKHATGSLYAVYEPGKNKVPIRPMQWNESKIVVCGNLIEHWLNGQLVVNVEVGRLDWLQRVEKSKFGDKPFFGQNRNGRLFLQDHGNPVWFRNIVVTPLDADR